MKRKFFSEAAYAAGLVILALGTALMERADLGMSMVVAPAYVLHRAISPAWSWFTFGAAEYTFQALLLGVMVMALRRFRVSYLFSFVTAVLYGFTLDAVMALTAFLPAEGLILRLVWYALGLVVCSVGVAFMFHTYIAPEVYELFVKELTARYGWNVGRCKTAYDCISCAAAMALSFACFGFGHFEGVKWGTVVCALVNGAVISAISRWMDAHWDFVDAFPSLHKA